jgi:hypothetical protein
MLEQLTFSYPPPICNTTPQQLQMQQMAVQPPSTFNILSHRQPDQKLMDLQSKS